MQYEELSFVTLPTDRLEYLLLIAVPIQVTGYNAAAKIRLVD